MFCCPDYQVCCLMCFVARFQQVCHYDVFVRFVHEKGCISVVLKKIDVPVPSYQNSVCMWSWCRKCKQVRDLLCVIACIVNKIYSN